MLVVADRLREAESAARIVVAHDLAALEAIVVLAEHAAQIGFLRLDRRSDRQPEVQRDHRDDDEAVRRDADAEADDRRADVQRMRKPAVRAGRCNLARLVEVTGGPEAQRFSGGGERDADRERSGRRLRHQQHERAEDPTEGDTKAAIVVGGDTIAAPSAAAATSPASACSPGPHSTTDVKA